MLFDLFSFGFFFHRVLIAQYNENHLLTDIKVLIEEEIRVFVFFGGSHHYLRMILEASQLELITDW